MYELLKPNGLVIIKTVCHGRRTFSNILQKLLLLPMVWMKLIPYINFTKMSDIKEDLCKQGFDIITAENLKNTDYFIVAKKR
jgi:dihydroorotate dehydrogenase